MSGLPPPTHPLDVELQCTLTRLVEVYTIARVIESLGVCCELRACQMREHDRATHRLRELGLQLILLSETGYSL
jgi:hypothetical protein